MDNKLVMTSIAAVIGIVVLGSVLMPILDDASTKSDTYTNEGYFDMTYTEADSIVMDWDHTDPKNITVNGETISLNDVTNQTTVLCGDLWLLRYDPAGGIAYYASAGSATGASVLAETDLHVEATGGTVTVTPSSGTAKTNTYTYLYCVDVDGDYVMKESTSAAYVKSDSKIYGMGLTDNVLSQSVYVKFDGTIEDPNASVFRYSGSSAITVDSTSVQATADPDHVDLYKLDKLVITVTDGTNTADLTYSYFIVPAEVTADRAVQFTDGEIAIFSAIPAMIILAILLGVVALVIRSRMD